jgi:hypothetical protein
MKGAIKDKLRAELEAATQSERQVVYILVELRKLMELNQDAEHLEALNFFCVGRSTLGSTGRQHKT